MLPRQRPMPNMQEMEQSGRLRVSRHGLAAAPCGSSAKSRIVIVSIRSGRIVGVARAQQSARFACGSANCTWEFDSVTWLPAAAET